VARVALVGTARAAVVQFQAVARASFPCGWCIRNVGQEESRADLGDERDCDYRRGPTRHRRAELTDDAYSPDAIACAASVMRRRA
jgi:hypothetical protein